MNFPKHLDEEDMELFRKEALLAGYPSEDHHWKKGRRERTAIAFRVRPLTRQIYVQAEGGLWVLIPDNRYEWLVAIDYADEYAFKHQDSLTDTST